MKKESNMTKEQKQWLKENEPWNYDAFYGDPVTGSTGVDYSEGIGVIFIGIAALVIWGLFEFFIKL